MSNRRRVIVAAITLVVLAIFVVPLALTLRSKAEQRATAEALRQAKRVSSQVKTADLATIWRTLDEINAKPGPRVTVFMPDGAVAGVLVPADPTIERAQSVGSFTVDRDGGRVFLASVPGAPGGIAVVRTFVPEQELYRGVDRAWMILAIITLLLVAGVVGVAEAYARYRAANPPYVGRRRRTNPHYA